ncbi:MAG: hypothetical protein AABY09_00615, partial [Nanoarchaeota archaeon]
RHAEEERKKREEGLRQRQIEAERRKEEYRKKIEEERKLQDIRKETPKAPAKNKVLKVLHNAAITKKEEESSRIKDQDRRLSNEIYKLLEELARHYVQKEYDDARITYLQIQMNYERLSEEGKAAVKPIINKVVKKINQ